MGYVVGEKILDDEYNAFVNNSSAPYGYNTIAGDGAGPRGLGQAELPVVVAGTQFINASNWNALFAGMDNIANHTNDSLTARGQVTAGDPIKIKSAVAADLLTLANSVAGGSVNATALTESSELRSAVASARFSATHIVEHSVTFASGDHLRYFFNAGGKIRIQLTRNANGGGSATDKDDSVDELISAMGNFDIGAQVSTRSGSGESLQTNGLANGVDDLGTSYTTLMVLRQSNGTYTSMDLKIEAKIDNATYGTGVKVTVKCSVIDADSGDILYTDGNLSSIDVNENFIGTTDWALHTMNPTTAQGLNPVYGISASAIESNNVANG